jgi:hypothetical protein
MGTSQEKTQTFTKVMAKAESAKRQEKHQVDQITRKEIQATETKDETKASAMVQNTTQDD